MYVELGNLYKIRHQGASLESSKKKLNISEISFFDATLMNMHEYIIRVFSSIASPWHTLFYVSFKNFDNLMFKVSL